MAYATIWSNVAGLTYQQAKAIAATRGGTLITDVSGGELHSSKILDWVYDNKTPTDNDQYARLWVGAELTSDGWRWSDGTVISKDRFRDETVNADDDPANDVAPVMSYSGLLYTYDPLSQKSPENSPIVSDGYVMDYATSDVVGTQADDYVVALGAVSSLKLLGGSDHIHYTDGASGVIDLGSGDDDALIDNFDFLGRRELIVIDGEGSDTVAITLGVIKASLDGDDDQELSVYNGRVSYEHATQDIVADGKVGSVRSVQIGDDYVSTPNLTLGSGHDTAFGWNTISGGNGNDTLTPTKKAEGGRGNDVLIADHVLEIGRVQLLGQEGDDTFVIRANAEMTGGSGSDLYIFKSVAKVTINDLGAGDRIDLSALLGDMSPMQARDGGFFKSSVSKGYTYGFIDLDGGGDDFVQLFALKGVVDTYSYFA